MTSEMDDVDFDNQVLVVPKNNKKLSIERIYQKKSQLEHILLRPDTYIGSVEPVTQAMWVYQEDIGMINKDVTFVPGLYKIFDEILVNAADNKQRDKTMDCIKIEIDPESNKISVWNNGQGIPVVKHQEENIFVPSMIFGQLLTSSNYNDDERKVTGGRNGYGAKLCNIFSTKFTVETATKMYSKHFKQTWYDNMSRCDQPNIKPMKGSDFTCITFHPDLEKFKMTVLEDDIIAIMTRRAYDIAGCTRGINVFLNNKRLPIKSFKDYIKLFVNDQPDVLVTHEISNDRWEVAATLSNSGFQQISFVNSIATTKGGRHVDYITEQLTSKISEIVKKKNKNGKNVKPFQIKSHIWMFVNCSIENPSFDSQTKENMTLQSKNFGSKCQVSDKFINEFMKNGIVESILSWVRFKAEAELEKKCSGKKHSKLKGIPKLEDANDAGTKNSVDCTLILTEGDSAKTLAVSGLGVVGRDKYGVFPLKGKILNVREATHKQILENAEINNIVKIMGLQYKKKYDSVDDLKTLRYGRLMIMTDQDQDGSHIKGLLINFIHHNWPSLLRLPFLEEFITPIVKAIKGKEEKCFYSLPEFEEWKVETSNWNKYKIKYYKGLGTSTAKEAKEYFSDMHRHRIRFHYAGTEDDHAIQLAFSKKMIENRKEWLSLGMEERKRRRELGLPEIYLYGKDTTTVTYNDFVNKELILFSNMDNERSIPSAMDGLKPGQRKVLYTCFKRNDKREVKVAQLVGSVAEQSAYHHGEQALAGTIIGLAQNFVGSNNINVLLPVGQFGTRLQGGKDSASPRYIFTMLSPIAKHLFSHFDTPLLNNQYDDNMKIEPEYYVPIIPMVLVNGTEGIGTGWSTKVPNHNPREIVENLLRMLDGEDPFPMSPCYKNYRGTIDKVDGHHYLTSGEIAIINENQIEITELPIRVWTQAYKENVLEPMLHGTEKISAFILDYKEYHTDTTVRFVVTMSPENFTQARNQGFHKVFKIQGSIALTSMVLFDNLGCLRRYESSEEILKEFYTVRLDLYVRRKDYMIGILSAEALKLRNQARFIIEKIENKVKIENRKKVDLLKTLIDRKYDSDPVKAWKEKQNVQEKNTGSDNENEDQESSSGPDYDYLLGMALWSLTKERVEDLLKKRDEKDKELEDLKKKSPSDLWKIDLSEFLKKLDEIEDKEKEESAMEPKLIKKGKGKKKVEDEDKPSKFGERVLPKVGEEYKTKWEKKPPKVPRESRNKNKLVNFDEENSNEPKVASPEKKQPKKPKSGLKQSTLKFKSEKTIKPISKPTKRSRKNASDSSEELFDDELQSEEEMQDKKEIFPRQASAKVNYLFSDDPDSDNNLSVEENSNQNLNPKTTNTTNSNASSTVKSDKFIDTHSKTSNDGMKATKVRKVEDEPNTDKASRVLAKQTNDGLENDFQPRTQHREPIKKKLPPKKKLAVREKSKLKRTIESEDEDFILDDADVEDVVPAKKARNVRQKVPKVYACSSEDEVNF